MEHQQPQFAEVTVLTHPEALEGLSDVLLSLGAKGVADQPRDTSIQVTAYLPSTESLDHVVRAVQKRLAGLEQQGLRIGPATIGLRTLGAQVWAEAWKDHFQVLHIAPGLVVAPSWEKYQPAPGERVVVLDPGLAFGTGDHGTTRLCLQALHSHLRPGDRVADVGCGSGILGVAAAVLGAGEVLATDSDAAALPVAVANARRNQVADRIQFLEADLLPDPCPPFDVIVCNIVSQQVVRLAQRLPAVLSPGGRFIGSGFLIPAVPTVEEALLHAGLHMLETLDEEGWTACVAVRPL